MSTKRSVVALGLKDFIFVEANNKVLISSLRHVSQLKNHLMKVEPYSQDSKGISVTITLSFRESHKIITTDSEIVIIVVLQGSAVIRDSENLLQETNLLLGGVYKILEGQEKIVINNNFNNNLIISLNRIYMKEVQIYG